MWGLLHTLCIWESFLEKFSFQNHLVVFLNKAPRWEVNRKHFHHRNFFALFLTSFANNPSDKVFCFFSIFRSFLVGPVLIGLQPATYNSSKKDSYIFWNSENFIFWNSENFQRFSEKDLLEKIIRYSCFSYTVRLKPAF